MTPGTGFSGSITLTASGFPKFSNVKFSPSVITNGGSSLMTVTTNRNVASGTSLLAVTATSGSVVHSTNVTLVVQ